MSKLNTMKFRLFAAIALLVAVSVVGITFSVKAYQNYSGATPKVVVEGDYIEAASQASSNDEILGAVSSPDIQSTWLCVNNDCEYHIVAPINGASSTFISFANPFGTSAVATVAMVRMNVTAAASTTVSDMYFNCGADDDGYGLPGTVLLDVDQFSAASSTAHFENNLTAALGGTLDGGTVAKVALTAAKPYFVCYASSTASLFDTTQTFAGKVTVKINKTRY